MRAVHRFATIRARLRDPARTGRAYAGGGVHPISRHRPLLCELHAHTTWSDGLLSLRELVDLYGETGFDVLCVSDHALPSWIEIPAGHNRIDESSFPGYLEAIEAEAERALARYGLLLLPGVELSFNADDPDEAAHAVVVGLRRFVSLEDGLEVGLCRARAAGGAIVAAHPYAAAIDAVPGRTTRRFFVEHEALSPLVDRHELFNRETLFSWVAEQGLPHVACGDFHRPRHLAGWKTLIPCAHEEEAVVEYLRSERPVMLTRLGIGTGAELRDAA